MKRFIWITLLAFASVCHAQTVRLGDVNMRNVVVVTNETAWKNPAAATNWTWASNGKEITLTGYSGPADVVMPDMLDGLPVTGFGTIFRNNQNITSVSGRPFITTIGDSAFEYSSLITANFPQVITIGDYAFRGASLTTANFPQATTIGDYAFASTSFTAANFPQVTTIGVSAFEGTSLTTANFPQATTIGNFAFVGTSLTSLYLGQNAPAEATGVFVDTPNAIVYVTTPTATGYGSTWNGMTVVRMPLFADKLTLKGTNIEDRITAKVDAAVADLPTLPTRFVAGTTYWDGGSNMVTVIVATNGLLSYFEVKQND